MQEASFTGILRTLAIILVIYYSFKIVLRYLFPFFIKRTMNKMEDKFKAEQEAQQPPKKVGETTIDRQPQQPVKKQDDSGEYLNIDCIFAIRKMEDQTGEMAEWSNALVLKTSEGHTSGGSNPSFSAKKRIRLWRIFYFL